jgi:hypothetical protein
MACLLDGRASLFDSLIAPGRKRDFQAAFLEFGEAFFSISPGWVKFSEMITMYDIEF